jgi:nocardicin N-oxygenase
MPETGEDLDTSQYDLDKLGPLPDLLADRSGPVVSVVTPTGGRMWLVRDHALSRLVLTDRRFSRAEAVKPEAPVLNDAQPAPDSMMSMDGSDHARLRRLVAGMFSTGRVAAMAPAIERVVGGHLDRIEAAGPGADLMGELAAPLPMTVLCSLLGIPEQDGARFRGWVEVLFDISATSPREKARQRLELNRYMLGLIRTKRGRAEPDVLGELIAAHDRGEMSLSELVTMGLALLMAGYETTVGQLGLTVLALLTDPLARTAAQESPAGLAATVEELTRLTPATPLSFPRVAVEAVPLGEVTVQPGEGVVVSLLDANRDHVAFPEPTALRVDRPGPAHLTFGHGAHRCLGAPLAGLQVRIAVKLLLRRFPGLRLDPSPDAVLWKKGFATRGLSRLRVTW